MTDQANQFQEREGFIKRNSRAWLMARALKGYEFKGKFVKFHHRANESSAVLLVEFSKQGEETRKFHHRIDVSFPSSANPTPLRIMVYLDNEKKWLLIHDFNKPEPQSTPGKPSLLSNRKALSIVTALLLLACLSPGYFLLSQMAEGLWAHTWQHAPGQWAKEGGGYEFTYKDSAGQEVQGTGYRRSTLKTSNQVQSSVLEVLGDAIDTSLLNRKELTVRVHPSDPRRSVLVAGVPVEAAYQLIGLMVLLGPALVLLLELLWAGPGHGLVERTLKPAGFAGVTYFVLFIASSGALVLWVYLLRTRPPAWPLLLTVVVVQTLAMAPDLARALYARKAVRRALYMVVFFAIMPFVAYGAGIAFSYVVLFVAAILLLGVLFSPLAGDKGHGVVGMMIALLWVPAYIAGIMAPARAYVLMLYSMFPYLPYYIGFPALRDPHLVAWHDVGVGLAGVLVAVLLTAIDTVWRYRQAKQVENLPTSTTRGAALGLCEFAGTVEPGPDAAVDEPVIAYNSRTGLSQIRPFYLRDKTGRILIDPREAKLRTGRATSYAGRICEVVLTKRVEQPDIATPMTMALMPGDQVYVVGNVEPHEGGMVVRPLTERFSGPLWKLAYGNAQAPLGRDIQHVFFLSDTAEHGAAAQIRRGLWQVWLWAALWVVMSLWMVEHQSPKLAPGYDHWSINEILDHAPSDVKLRYALKHLSEPLEASVARQGTVMSIVGHVPFIGQRLVEANTALELTQRARAINYLWGYEVDAASSSTLEAVLGALASQDADARRWAAHALRAFQANAKQVVPALAQALKDKEPTVASNAATSLGEMGQAGLMAGPELAELLSHEDLSVRKSAIWALIKLPVTFEDGMPLYMALLKSADPELRAGGAQGLQKYGPKAQAAVDKLSALVKDPDKQVRHTAIVALGKIGPGAARAVEAMAQGLLDADDGTRQFTATALGEIGPAAKGALPYLIMAADSSSGWAKIEVLKAIEKIAPEEADAAAALGRALSDQMQDARRQAALSLVRMGVNAAPALGELTAALSSDDAEVARNSARALEALGARALGAGPELVRLAGHSEPLVRRAALEALASIGWRTEEFMAQLETMRNNDPDKFVRDEAWRTMERLYDTPERRGALDVLAKKQQDPTDIFALMELLKDHQPNVRRSAAADIGQLGRAGLPALGAIIALMDDPSPYARAQAANTVGKIGLPEALEAKAKLLALMGDADAYVRINAMEALGTFGQQAGPDAARLMARQLSSKEQHVAVVAARALGAIALSAQDAVPALDALLHSPQGYDRQEAALALKSYGPAAVSATASLMVALKDSDYMVQRNTVQALGAIGAGARQAVPALVDLLSSNSGDLKYYAIGALGDIGPGAASALDKLKAIENDTTAAPFLKNAAREALGKIGR